MRNDPFTSDHARVPIALAGQASKVIAAVIDANILPLARAFGPMRELKWREYYGTGGEWVAGFRSEYGFHVRGRGDNAAAAVADAIRSRLVDDPSPQDAQWKGARR